MEQITIAGVTFNVPVRFAEGYTLNAAEARALNQTFHQNLRVGFSGRIRANPPKTEDDQELLQLEFDEFAASYQFGAKATKAAVDHLIDVEAMAEARRRIKSAIHAAIRNPDHAYYGKRVIDFESKAINELAKKRLKSDPSIMQWAKARIEEAQNLAAKDLEGLMAKPKEASK